jgi:hypothetical protein
MLGRCFRQQFTLKERDIETGPGLLHQSLLFEYAG